MRRERSLGVLTSTKGREVLAVIKGTFLVGVSFLVLAPQVTGLTRLPSQLGPGLLALSVSIGFALAVIGGYVVAAASAGRRNLKRAAVLSGVAFVCGAFVCSLIIMLVVAEGESLQFQVARTIVVAIGVMLGVYLRTPRPPQKIKVPLLEAKELRMHLQRRAAASHNYVRHIVSNLIKWYTFFVGVNYVSMGWFATHHDELASSNMILLIAGMFIMQNVLGIMACMRIKRYLLATGNEIIETEQGLVGKELSDEAREALIPSLVYSRSIQLMITGLVFIVLVWAALPFFMEENVAIKFVKHLFP